MANQEKGRFCLVMRAKLRQTFSFENAKPEWGRSHRYWPRKTFAPTAPKHFRQKGGRYRQRAEKARPFAFNRQAKPQPKGQSRARGRTKRPRGDATRRGIAKPRNLQDSVKRHRAAELNQAWNCVNGCGPEEGAYVGSSRVRLTQNGEWKLY